MRKVLVLLLAALAFAVAATAPVQAVFSASASNAQRATAGNWATVGTSLWWSGQNSDSGTAGEGGTQDPVAARSPLAVADSGTFSQVATGQNFACAIRAAASGGQPAGSAVCWGYGVDGQNGNGAFVPFSTTPQAVSGAGTWRQLAASSTAVCGVQTDGSLWCWGYWANNQLGTTGTASRATPTQVTVAGMGSLTSISGAGNRFCALTAAGALWCWGENSTGAVGTGAAGSAVTPVQVASGVTWSQVSTGQLHTCAIASGGQFDASTPAVAGGVYCWGKGTDGRLGDAGTADHYSPALASALVATVPGATWTSVASGNASSCAITAVDGQLWCWGVWPRTGSAAATPTQVPGTWTRVVQNSGFGGSTGNGTCAIASDQTMSCLGDNGGVFGDGRSPSIDRDSMGAVVGGLSWSSVALGRAFGCGTTSAARLYCWGAFNAGQLATGGQKQWTTARDTGAGTGAWSAVNVTNGTACALKGTAAYCWGAGSNGQLGNGSTVDSGTPQLVLGGTGSWLSVTAGESFACGLDTTGVAWCWGYGLRLGNGDTSGSTAPKKVATTAMTTSTSWTAIDAGERSACGVRNDGSLWCWGENTNGEVGNGSTSRANVPVRVGSASDWTSVEVGIFTTCGTRRGGALYCWGLNSSGQLGNGTTTRSTTPVRVVGTSDGVWADFAIGTSFVCAVDTQGRLWCWGTNNDGQFGNGTTTSSTTPVLGGGAAGGRRWSTVTAGNAMTCGVSTDGTYCFGYNAPGQFGDGTTTAQITSPRKVPFAVKAVTITQNLNWYVR